MVANIAFRLGYGVGGLIAPTAMAKLRLAPDLRERPDAQLFVRGFSAHQIAVAALGLASLRWRRLEQPAALAAVAIDAADMVAAAIEASERRRLDEDLTGGLIFSAAGAISAGAALAGRSEQALARLVKPHELKTRVSGGVVSDGGAGRCSGS